MQAGITGHDRLPQPGGLALSGRCSTAVPHWGVEALERSLLEEEGAAGGPEKRRLCRGQGRGHFSILRVAVCIPDADT